MERRRWGWRDGEMEDERERNWISKRSMSTHKVIQEHKTKQNEDRVEGGCNNTNTNYDKNNPATDRNNRDPTSASETYAKKPNDPRTRLTQPPPTPNR